MAYSKYGEQRNTQNNKSENNQAVRAHQSYHTGISALPSVYFTERE